MSKEGEDGEGVVFEMTKLTCLCSHRSRSSPPVRVGCEPQHHHWHVNVTFI